MLKNIFIHVPNALNLTLKTLDLQSIQSEVELTDEIRFFNPSKEDGLRY